MTNIMEYKSNALGDIAIFYVENKELPDIDYTVKNHVVICNAPMNFRDPRLPCFIGTTPENGRIYGNCFAVQNFPVIMDGVTQGGCSVIFATHNESTYAVLVQIKKRAFLMNTAGFADIVDMSLKDTALREACEETGLKINSDSWKRVAEWKFKHKFAELPFNGYTLSGVCWADNLPTSWTETLNDGPIYVIPIDNEETESVVLVNISALQEYNSSMDVWPTRLSEHHFNIIVQAAMNENLLPKTCKEWMTKGTYLTEFTLFSGSEW